MIQVRVARLALATVDLDLNRALYVLYGVKYIDLVPLMPMPISNSYMAPKHFKGKLWI